MNTLSQKIKIYEGLPGTDEEFSIISKLSSLILVLPKNN